MRSALPNSANPQKPQESYVRQQDNTYFDGMRKVDRTLVAQGPALFSEGRLGDRNSPTSPAICDDSYSKRIILNPSENVSDQRSKNRVSSVHLLETYERSFSGRRSKFQAPLFSFPRITSDYENDLSEANTLLNDSNVQAPVFSFPNVASPSENDLGEANTLLNDSMLRNSESDEEFFSIPVQPKPTLERRYSVNRRKSELSKIPLPQSAASFYSGNLLLTEIIESCESINRLNLYLETRRDDIRAGVPGRFLHAVIGPEVTDVGSAASSIMYAFYLNETMKSSQLCTVPVINMKRADLDLHAELKWLLESCQIDLSSLIFIDEIDLLYYFMYGSLKLVLMNDNKLPHQQEMLKDALVEIFNCKQGSTINSSVETVTIGQECSCCTLIAEKFSMVSPETLAGQGFSRLLLAAILLDTGNLKNPQCTSKDKYMATLLINGAGRFGCNGLYQILKYKMHDITDLKLGDILRKDFKKWTRVGKADNNGSRLMVSHIGMSSIGVSVGQLLNHNDSAPKHIVHFQQSEKLRLLMIVSGYYDSQKNFKREILVSAESVDLMRNLLHFFNSNASQLPLKVLHLPDLRDEFRAFEIDNMITSRKTIERLMEEFGGTSRR